ncbi:MAG: hypothetical protein ACFFAO_18095 [Candidatus Hermodarchaeota archaeon]
MSGFQNFSLSSFNYEDLEFSKSYRNFKLTLDPENITNIQKCVRNEYVPSIISVIFKGDISSQLTSHLSKYFMLYLDSENRFFHRDKIINKLKLILKQEFQDNINNYLISLKKIQYLIRYIEFDNYRLKNDLCRIERFFLNLIMRKYTDNLVRGHRKSKL